MERGAQENVTSELLLNLSNALAAVQKAGLLNNINNPSISQTNEIDQSTPTSQQATIFNDRPKKIDRISRLNKNLPSDDQNASPQRDYSVLAPELVPSLRKTTSNGEQVKGILEIESSTKSNETSANTGYERVLRIPEPKVARRVSSNGKVGSQLPMRDVCLLYTSPSPRDA